MTRPLTPLLALLCAAACNSTDPPIADDSTGTAGSTDTTAAGTAASTGVTSGPDDPTTGGTDATDPASSSGSTGADGVVGCDGAPLLPVPEDTSMRGPWPVGARTGTVDDMSVEIWYPAAPGSERGAEKVRYDIRTALPDADQGKIPDADNPWQDCDCYRDLPIDDAHGPYPAVVFVHGTAGFRSQSLEFMTHWASRGFVVVAADHPGLWLKHLLGVLCGEPGASQDLGGDLDALVAALTAQDGDLEFLAGNVDAARLAMTGHSAGGFAVESAGDVAQVVMPMAGRGVSAGDALRSVLVLGAQDDKVVDYSEQQDGYASSPAPKRLVGIAGTGHLAFSSLCSLRNAAGEDFLEIAMNYDICGAGIAGALFDCDDAYLPDATSWQIVQYTTSAALEETLHCRDGDPFAGLVERFPDIGEFLAE